ncbi:MAG: acyl-ACP--UDP-N-acetylglucosamine O-acyltransferase [Deltaproteobacteria bacterium]|nr:acyl-ACP--UDP-N-acetylglucosamine O-acyltransferase [Deltaproteobacteria bacterium]
MNVHPSATVSKDAKLGDIEVGPCTVIGPDVRIGDGTVIGPFVVIDGHTEIGSSNRIFQFASIGSPPQDLKYKNEPTRLVIGDNNIIREHVVINPGTVTGRGVTTIGNRNMLMTGSHVAHDCIVGDEVIFANGATLAGHVTVESMAILGGLIAIHQFARIGKLAMVGGGRNGGQDVPPFAVASGDRARLYGINLIGLRRRGYTKEKILLIERAYRLLFRSTMGLADAVKKVNDEFPPDPDIRHIVEFVQTSTRGVCRYRL